MLLRLILMLHSADIAAHPWCRRPSDADPTLARATHATQTTKKKILSLNSHKIHRIDYSARPLRIGWDYEMLVLWQLQSLRRSKHQFDKYFSPVTERYR